MVRFLRKWLVFILAGLMLIGIAIAFVPISRYMETRAESELTLLMDRAFARVQASGHAADPVIAAEEENLLSKAKAVGRFLAHDDTLLATDALTALCEQLSIDRIDIADADGTLIASSEGARIGLSLAADATLKWTMSAADNAEAELVQADETKPSVLYACVGRSDIEGFVLLTRDDSYVASALAQTGTETLLSDLPYGGDVLFEAAEAGEDGFFNESGNLCLRHTADGVTLIAARPLAEVYAIRNAAALAFAAALACIMICGVAAYLLNLEPVSTTEEEEEGQPEATLEAAEEPAGLLQEQPEAEEEPEVEQPRTRRRLFRKREEQLEETQEQEEIQEQHEESVEHAPRQVSVGGRKHTRHHSMEEDAEDSEDAFDKIVE